MVEHQIVDLAVCGFNSRRSPQICMSLEHRIQRVPRNRPDITPVIYGDSSAASAIARVNSPERIDAFVYYLRAEFFRQWLGYEPPLVADRPIFSNFNALTKSVSP